MRLFLPLKAGCADPRQRRNRIKREMPLQMIGPAIENFLDPRIIMQCAIPPPAKLRKKFPAKIIGTEQPVQIAARRNRLLNFAATSV